MMMKKGFYFIIDDLTNIMLPSPIFYHVVYWAVIVVTFLPYFTTTTLNNNNNNLQQAVNGFWSAWSTGPCSVTCGEGRRKRERKCDNPPPSNGGLPCPGLGAVLEACRLLPCTTGVQSTTTTTAPILISSQWSSWSACSGSCGLGTRKRTRPCTSQDKTPCSDLMQQIETCSDDAVIPPCPVNGAWSSWITFLPCPTHNTDKICQYPKRYQQVQVRMCSEPYPAYGGKDCEGPEFSYTSCAKLTAFCADRKPHWTPWSPGKCSVTCGIGVEKKTRACIGATNGHSKCSGPSVLSEECKMPPCPVMHGGWSQWRESQSCIPAKVGYDPCKETQMRILERQCNNPPPTEGGLPCQGEWRRSESCRDFFKCNSVNSASTIATEFLSKTTGLPTTTTKAPSAPTYPWAAWECIEPQCLVINSCPHHHQTSFLFIGHLGILTLVLIIAKLLQ